MPLALHAKVKHGKVSVNFDLSAWCSQNGATAGKLPPQLAALSQALQDHGRSVNIRDVARRAVKKAAAAKIIHTDLEWRHVALLPKFSNDGARFVGLEPILIDFGSTAESGSEQEALDEMNRRLDALEAECSW